MSKASLPDSELNLIQFTDSENQTVSIADLVRERSGLVILTSNTHSVIVTELCARLRDNMKIFRSLNTEVILVSQEAPEALQAYKASHNLNFTLLSDTNRSVYSLDHLSDYKKETVVVLIYNQDVKAQVIDTITTATQEIPLNDWMRSL